jgi:peptide/nickel transport system permease protein
MRLITFIGKRLIYSIFVLLGLSILIFTLSRVLPGDVARMIMGSRADEGQLIILREQLHLNDPLYVQYGYWLRDALQLNLGNSYIITKQPVLYDIIHKLPPSLELVFFAAAIEIVGAIVLGMLAGRRANTWVDNVVRLISYVGVAVPSFVVAIVLIVVFANYWRIFPSSFNLSLSIELPRITGFVTIDSLLTGNVRAFFDAIYHLILPGFALALGGLAQDARITRSSVVDNLNKDYINSAISHGLPESKITLKYLMKPSLIPTVSILGLDVAALLSNAFMVEMIFNWPGFSKYAMQGMLQKDLNIIVSSVLVVGLFFALTNIVVDVVVAYLDPRIRFVEKAK